MMMMLSAFHASQLTKAAAQEPVASKITPEIQPPNGMPSTDEDHDARVAVVPLVVRASPGTACICRMPAYT
jgi:hypothetical protein